jgi:molybdate transport system ATP-binding protein
MIEIDINKRINDRFNLKIKLAIKEGDFVSITGKSGSGKTTLLRVLSGLEEANGIIKVNNKIWLNNNFALPPQKREIGFVFQDYALFPNMSVLDNLLFVKNDKELAHHLLHITEMIKFKNQMPNTLSGGQKQRVSLCRAFMKKPKLLLLDEPLSALDLQTRIKLQDEILLLHKEFGITTILVSHDTIEIKRLCNRVVMLDNGNIIQDSYFKNNTFMQNSSSNGKILDIKQIDMSYVAMVLVENQIIEINIDKNKANQLSVGQKVNIAYSIVD